MKLAAIDLDGTLLNSQGEISEENKAALTAFKQDGGIVTIATGRNLDGGREIFSQLELEGYLLASNGACVAHTDKGAIKEILKTERIETETTKELFRLAAEQKVAIIASRDGQDDQLSFDESGIASNNPYYKQFNINEQDYEEFEKHFDRYSSDYLKIVLTDKNETKLQNLQKRLLEKEIISVFSDPHFLEISPKGINKAESLHFLAQNLGLSKNDIVAFGDQENDIDMLKYSGTAIAMQNAQPIVKEIADMITGTNDENGVAQFLEEFCNEEEIKEVTT